MRRKKGKVEHLKEYTADDRLGMVIQEKSGG